MNLSHLNFGRVCLNIELFKDSFLFAMKLLKVSLVPLPVKGTLFILKPKIVPNLPNGADNINNACLHNNRDLRSLAFY